MSDKFISINSKEKTKEYIEISSCVINYKQILEDRKFSEKKWKKKDNINWKFDIIELKKRK